MTPEFSLIERFFTRPAPSATLGVGDDAALFAVSPGMELAVSTDMLVAGTHFFPDVDPRKLGWKTLAVNVSDLAAMGAQPKWATLSLALPEIDEIWLGAFAEGFFQCANQYGVELIGGDTTRGPLNLSVTIFGEVPRGQALRRDRAEVGDDVWVSGTLGGPALGLAALQSRASLENDALQQCVQALEQPWPRVELGLALRGIAHAAIDISDGFLADLGHILERSRVGANIEFDALPAHAALVPKIGSSQIKQCVLAGGDDYELCFTAPAGQREAISAIATQLGLGLSRVGCIVPGDSALVLDASGNPLSIERTGYDHFA
ncbi:thiamine-monophosphate kinase [Novimethylophilus kurashikiensis]|uniref:Thiamine-monophosphate kinase n=1 Tax=Novimethylophilus kurashikiensis TaxID=1825523 RepID=A0A2R5F810_9PROT|nr:thiamine-phosphate kinase [Novimethylophilus kurashikiensis]GBG14175.1 thiamine-monophosphate kinase [Novimethylophilus kurashikiensis]